MGLLEALLLDPLRVNVWIAVRTDGAPGTGTQNDPYNGSSFDAVMNGISASPPTRVHLGPGTFQTARYADGTGGGWQPKPGMKIVGSGIGVTTLQLVGATSAAHYYAIGHGLPASGQQNLVDYFEVSDLTIDCNLAAAGNQTAVGAVRVMGNHAKVRRVKVVNWGTKTTGKACFVVSVVTAHQAVGASVEDCGIEECIAITPGTGNTGPVTVLHAGGYEGASSVSQPALGIAPYIRNCFVDCGLSDPTQGSEIRGLSLGWCKGGVLEGNQVHNTTYGVHCDQPTVAQDIVARNNWFKNVAKGIFLDVDVRNLILEGNVMELATATSGSIIGIHAEDNDSPSYVFGKAIIRDNKIRYVDGGTSINSSSYPLQINGAEDLLVRNNVVEWGSGVTHPLRNVRCGAVEYFNNQSPAGAAVLGWNEGTSANYEELSTMAEFALVMGLFNRRT